MSGKPINPEQVKVYMRTRKEGKTQVTAAAKAGMSERSGRRAEKRELQPERKGERHWRTRPDPFADVWESEIVPLLKKNPQLTPMTLFEKLQKDHPGEYQDSKLRTLQRRVSKWKALYGPDKEVMFRQEQVAGRMGISDFTTLKEVTITIQGQPFTHLLYHFRLAFSGWCSVKVVHGGESYTALAEGLQDALCRLGGVPHEHRSDSLSAAYRNLNKDAAEDVTERYQQLCYHYGMEPTRNNRGKGHENGAIESPHGHLKKRIHQALLLRDSCNFDTVTAYEEFLAEIVRDINSRQQDKIEEERQHLQPLPLHRTADYTEKVVPVSTSSTIKVKRVLYTVPSRLIGERLRVHIYDNRLDVYLGSTLTVTLPRAFASDNKHRARQVDYRHVIASLEKKPQAFRYSQLRDDLFPDETYKAVWAWLDGEMEARKACKTMVGILALAHRADCEKQLGEHLQIMMSSQSLPRLYELRRRFDPREQTVPTIRVNQPPVSSYDALLFISSQEEY
ncbi:MAG: IS21 family transposase [Thermodesulfobacteriota bacterium]